ncbi:hypothetical protein BVX99_03455, partial [bacterium F16]
MVDAVDIGEHNEEKRKIEHLLGDSFLKKDYKALSRCFGLPLTGKKRALVNELRKSGYGWLAEAVHFGRGQLLIPESHLDDDNPKIEVKYSLSRNKKKHTLHLYDAICPVTGKLLWYLTNQVSKESKQSESIFDIARQMDGLWIYGPTQTMDNNSVIKLKNGTEVNPGDDLFTGELETSQGKQVLIPVSIQGKKFSVIKVAEPPMVSLSNVELVVSALLQLAQGKEELVEEVKRILKNKSLVDLHLQAVRWLHERDEFEKDIRYWELLCEDDSVSDSAKGGLFIVGALLSRKSPDTLLKLHRVLRKALEIPSLRDEVLDCVEAYLPGVLKDYVLMCLEKAEGINAVGPYLRKFGTDIQVIEKLSVFYNFDPNSASSASTLIWVTPLLAKSSQGQGKLAAIAKSSAKGASVLTTILINNASINGNVSEVGVIEITKSALQLHKDDKIYGFAIKQAALPYLCNEGDSSAIK